MNGGKEKRRNAMCNKLHPDSLPIPATGFGWKLTVGLPDNKHGKWFVEGKGYGFPYVENWDGWIKWDESLAGPDDEGFAFFPNYREISLRYKHHNRLKKIQYGGGLGRHHENGMGSTIALCKAFRIIEEEEPCKP
jgi:hypothetical protein